MVAGGVGLAPFATLTEALVARGTTDDAVLRRPQRRELFYLDWFRVRGVRLVLATEDGSAGERGRVTVPLERELQTGDAAATSWSTRAVPSRCSKPWRTLRPVRHGRRRCRWSA